MPLHRRHPQSPISAGRRRCAATVVIAGAETVTGMNAARALRGKGLHIVGVSSDLAAPPSRSRVWDRLYYSPRDDDDFLQTLEEIGTKQLGLDESDRPVLLVSSDAQVLAAGRERVMLNRMFRLVLPDPESLHRLMDKTAFQEWAVENGFSIPGSSIVTTAEAMDAALAETRYPLAVKPLVRTPAWDARFPSDKLFVLEEPGGSMPEPAELLALSPRMLVQQWIPGGDEDVLFCLAYAQKDCGRVLATYCGQKWLQWPPLTGSTAICAGLEHPELEAMSIRLLEQAGLRGLGSVEVKRDPRDGTLYLTEPTVGRNDFQSYVAVAGGVNLTWLAVCDAFDWELPRFRYNVRATWADERGLVQSARRQHRWADVARRLVSRRPTRVSWALMSPRDPMPALHRVRTMVAGMASRRQGAKEAAESVPYVVAVERNERRAIRVRTTANLGDLASHWDRIRAASGADPLFMSLAWQSAWWETYSDAYRLEGAFTTLTSPAGEVFGIAPFVRRTGELRRMRVRRLEMMGNVWREQGPMRSEYLDLLLDPAHRDASLSALLDDLGNDGTWQEFVFSDLDEASPTYEAFACRRLPGVTRRVPWHEQGFVVDTRGDLDDYKAKLTGNARRKLFLQRGRLAKRGPVSLRDYGFEQFADFARVLDRLHALRWGRPFFVGRMRKFHDRLLERLGPEARSRMSVMEVGGVAVSALYDIEIDGREYNLQGGFDASGFQGLSVAKLHLGLVIERAFAESTRSLELLVGGGRKDDFKREFAAVARSVATVHLVRDPLLRAGYAVMDGTRGWRGRAAVPGPADGHEG